MSLRERLERWAQERANPWRDNRADFLAGAFDMIQLLSPLVEAAERMRDDANRSRRVADITNGVAVSYSFDYGAVADALRDLEARLGGETPGKRAVQAQEGYDRLHAKLFAPAPDQCAHTAEGGDNAWCGEPPGEGEWVDACAKANVDLGDEVIRKTFNGFEWKGLKSETDDSNGS